MALPNHSCDFAATLSCSQIKKSVYMEAELREGIQFEAFQII
jgi:hypothetical protein